jgi:hypothetical protein
MTQAVEVSCAESTGGPVAWPEKDSLMIKEPSGKERLCS